MDMDKRLHPRVETNFELKIHDGDTFHWTVLRSLSGGGVFVQTDTPLEVGSTVSLELALPVADKAMHIQGRVQWIQPGNETAAPGMGIKFTGISEQQRQNIIRFIGDIVSALGKGS